MTLKRTCSMSTGAERRALGAQDRHIGSGRDFTDMREGPAIAWKGIAQGLSKVMSLSAAGGKPCIQPMACTLVLAGSATQARSNLCMNYLRNHSCQRKLAQALREKKIKLIITSWTWG